MAMRQGAGPSAGNVRLKALRHSRGWVSQQQLADAFERKALECGLRLGVSVRQVRRWESADPPWPTPDYQLVLQALFDRPLTDLGFTPPWQAELEELGELEEIGDGFPHAAPPAAEPGPRHPSGTGGAPPAPRPLPASAPAPPPAPGGGAVDAGRAQGRGPVADGAPGPAPGSPAPRALHGAMEAAPRAQTRRRGPLPQPGTEGERRSRGAPGAGPLVIDGRRLEHGPFPQEGRLDAPGTPAAVRARPPYGGTDPAAPERPPLDGPASGPEVPEPPGTGRRLESSVESSAAPALRPSPAASPQMGPLTVAPVRMGVRPFSPPAQRAAAAARPVETATPALLRQILQAPRRAPEVPVPARSGQLGSATAEQYAALTTSYRQMYWVAPSNITFAPVAAHVRLGTRLLSSTGPARARRIVAASLAETAMLAGRIAFFDLHLEDDAKRYYLLARQAANEAGDPLLATATLAHTAFVPAFAENPNHAEAENMIGYTRRSKEGRNAPAAMRAWLAAIHSEFETLRGDTDAALRLLDEADDLMCHPEDRRAPAWFDFFDASRLWGFRGRAEIAAGRTEDARTSLGDALDNLPITNSKQRAVMFADLARVAYQAGDVDEACAMLSSSLQMLAQQWYATAMDRVRMTRRELAPYANASSVKRLDEELQTWRDIEPDDGPEYQALPSE